jgi:hypothetical protein
MTDSKRSATITHRATIRRGLTTKQIRMIARELVVKAVVYLIQEAGKKPGWYSQREINEVVSNILRADPQYIAQAAAIAWSLHAVNGLRP